MSVASFVPEIWDARLRNHLDKSLVFGALCNRDYEGDITAYGDTVHINKVGNITVSAYTGKLGDPEELNTSSLDLKIDQWDFFNFTVSDIEKAQAMPTLVESATQRAAYAMNDETDQFIAKLMATEGTKMSGTVALSAANVYSTLVDMSIALDKKNVPSVGRWVVVTPDVYGLLLLDDRFVNYGTDANRASLTNGLIGSAAGFTIYKSNNVYSADSGTTFSLVAGTNDGASFADQITETEALRASNSFADIVRGLHVYGAKVVEADEICVCDVTIA